MNWNERVLVMESGAVRRLVVGCIDWLGGRLPSKQNLFNEYNQSAPKSMLSADAHCRNEHQAEEKNAREGRRVEGKQPNCDQDSYRDEENSVANRRRHHFRLTRMSSAAAGENERGLKWGRFHNLVRGIGAASG